MRTAIVVLAGLVLFVSLTVVTAEDEPDHARPESLSATCGSGTANLGWSAVTDQHLSGYDLYRRRAGETGFVKVNSQTITVTSYVDSGLQGSTTYEYGAKAVYNDNHTSPMSPTATCTTP